MGKPSGLRSPVCEDTWFFVPVGLDISSDLNFSALSKLGHVWNQKKENMKHLGKLLLKSEMPVDFS